MADETTAGAANTGGDPGTNANAAATGGETATQNAGENQQQQTAARSFSQADVDRIVQERLAEERQRGRKTNEQRIGELEQQLTASRREALVARVAAKHQLPPALADRLRGATEAELEADAQALAGFAQTTARGSADGGAGGGAAPQNMNDFIRRSAGRR